MLEELLEDGFLTEKPNAIWYGGWVFDHASFVKLGKDLRDKHGRTFNLGEGNDDPSFDEIQAIYTLRTLHRMSKFYHDRFPWVGRCAFVQDPKSENWIIATQSEVGGSEVDWKRPPNKVIPKRDVDDKILRDMLADGAPVPNHEYVTIYIPRPREVHRFMLNEAYDRAHKYMAEHPGAELW